MAAALLPAQMQPPHVGVIDFYGLRKVQPERVRASLAVRPGDRLPSSKGNIEDALEAVPGIVQARLQAACCEEGKAILYIGLEERGAQHFDLHLPPDQALELPRDIVDAYGEFLQKAEIAARVGGVHESLSEGHSLFSDAATRAVQQSFIALTGKHLALLKQIVREAHSEEYRAIAAYVLGYAPDKSKVVDDLQYALRDADETVRSNAMRALAAMAVYAQTRPDSGVKIQPTWFIEMLSSIVWTDRNNAAVALVTLTDTRDANVLAALRQRALPSLAEMARWQHLPHALPAYIVLGRVTGLAEDDIKSRWSKGEREAVIAQALKTP